MEITTIEFEGKLVLNINNQKVCIIPFLTQEHGNIKFGIDAPRGVGVDREEVHKRKQEKIKLKFSEERLD